MYKKFIGLINVIVNKNVTKHCKELNEESYNKLNK